MSKRRVFIVVAIAAFLGALYGAAYAYVGDQIPRGATVNGINIGGMDRQTAIQTLKEKIQLPKKIKVVANKKSATIKPTDSGISLDFERTVDGFQTRSANPLKLFGYLIAGRNNDVSVPVDVDALTVALERLRAAAADAPREGNITFLKGQPIAIRPLDGTDLDLKTLTQGIQRNILNGKVRFYAQVVPAKARVSWETVQSTLENFARPAISAPITINVDGKPITVTPDLIANSLIFTPKGDSLVPSIVSEHLITDLGEAWDKNVIAPQSATFKSINGKLEVIPSAAGRDVPPEKLSDAVVSILTKTEDRVVDVTTEEIQPKLTTEQALGLDIKDRIGHFTTRFPWTWYRAHNIHRAADILNGTIVEAGEIFSLNQTLGQRTAENGFVEGVVISGGRLAKDFGGGVSQISTTTYNAAWFAGLKILRHKPHSFYISRYPVGRESTLSWPDVDMRFQNDTEHPIVITTSYYSNVISVSIYGTRKYDVETITGPRTNPRGFDEYEDDSKTCINQGGISGFDIEVTRILKQSGMEVRREVYKTRYLSEDRVKCTNPEATFGNH